MAKRGRKLRRTKSGRIDRRRGWQPAAQTAGGKAVTDKVPPANCPECNMSLEGWSWHSYLAHLSQHSRGNR